MPVATGTRADWVKMTGAHAAVVPARPVGAGGRRIGQEPADHSIGAGFWGWDFTEQRPVADRPKARASRLGQAAPDLHQAMPWAVGPPPAYELSSNSS